MTDQQVDFVQLQSDFSQAIDALILDVDFTNVDFTIPDFDW
ncbi:MAG: hypothetical protein Q4C79_01160 [Neisseria sp.]|nr:hypothetical protein [Neisseria sp.]MDO4247568.1 hypothetical protein [Neisseria sp.]